MFCFSCFCRWLLCICVSGVVLWCGFGMLVKVGSSGRLVVFSISV